MANTLNLGNGDWATKENSLLGYNSENGNYKPLPFDFTRASNATFVNKSGLIETAASGVPRIDFLGNTSGALLLEPQSTNLQTYSSDLASVYVPENITQTSNYSISPDGSSTSTRLVLGNFTDSRSVENFTGVMISGNTYTFSCYYKGIKGETTYMNFLKNPEGLHTFKEIVFTGEWQRESITFTAGSASNYTYIVDVRRGASTASDFEVWGAQLEQGSYATSLINTQGSAVTRVADVCSNGGNDQVINSTEGVLYFEGSAIANDGTFKRISVGTSDNLFANSIQLRYNIADNSITYQFRVGNVYQADITTTINSTNINKIACVWETNRFEIWINGIKKAEDTSGSVPPSNTFNSLFFGKTSIGLEEAFKGNVKDLKIYNTALTDAELIALTTT